MKNEKTTKTLIPCRVVVGVLGCLACCLLYVLRSNLNVAIIAMVDEKHTINTKPDDNRSLADDVCYDYQSVNQSNITTTYNKGRYEWTQSTQGLILGSYFYGYTLTQTCGSYGDKFGAKWMIGLGVFLPAILNAFIPIAADIHYTIVVVLRVLMGAFHGVIFSGMFSMFTKWFPQSETNLALTGVIFSGNFGGVITMPLVGYLSQIDYMGGWPIVFYFTSFIHIFWFILWIYFVSDKPEDSTRITKSELDYILDNNITSKNVRNRSIPWRQIMLSKAVWASIVSKMCGSFGYFVLCTKMPAYLDTVYGMSIQTNSWFNSLFYATLCASILSSGPLSTWVHSKHWVSLTRTRKNFQSFGTFGCCICLAMIPWLGCDSGAVISMILVGVFLFGFITGGEYACIPEYAPNYSGTVFGISNTFGVSTGFIGPQIVGLLLDYADGSSVRHQWNLVWYLSAAIYAFGGVFFEIYATADPQAWALVDDDIDVINELNTNKNSNNNNINESSLMINAI